LLIMSGKGVSDSGNGYPCVSNMMNTGCTE